jgi:hypothetical protein
MSAPADWSAPRTSTDIPGSDLVGSDGLVDTRAFRAQRTERTEEQWRRTRDTPARWSWTISSGTASPSTRADPDDRALGVLPGRGGRRVHAPEVPPVLDDGIDLGTMTVGRFEANEEQKLLLQALAASLTANPGAGTDKVPGLPGGTAQPHRPHPDRQGRHGPGLPGPRPGSQPVCRGEGTGECRCLPPPPTACSVSGRRVGSSGSCVIRRSSACTRHGPRRRGMAYSAMDYVEGGDLGALIASRRSSSTVT